MFIQMLWAIRDAHKNGIEEEDFSAVNSFHPMPGEHTLEFLTLQLYR